MELDPCKNSLRYKNLFVLIVKALVLRLFLWQFLVIIRAYISSVNLIQTRMFPIMTMIVLTALACTLRLLGSPSYGSLASSAGLRDHRGRIEHFSYPPEDVPGPKPLSAWVKQYERAKSQGLIPSIRPSVLNNGEPEYPSYSQSTISNPKNICSWTVSGCYSPDE